MEDLNQLGGIDLSHPAEDLNQWGGGKMTSYDKSKYKYTILLIWLLVIYFHDPKQRTEPHAREF